MKFFGIPEKTAAFLRRMAERQDRMRPHTNDQLVVLGEVPYCDIVTARQAIAASTLRTVYWLHQANPVLVRINDEQVETLCEQYIDGFNSFRHDQSCLTQGGPASKLVAYIRQLGRTGELEFTNYYLVMTPEAVEVLTKPFEYVHRIYGDQHGMTMLQMLRHLGAYQGAVVVSGGPVEFTPQLNNHDIITIARSVKSKALARNED